MLRNERLATLRRGATLCGSRMQLCAGPFIWSSVIVFAPLLRLD